jgi:hypothetical protein
MLDGVSSTQLVAAGHGQVRRLAGRGHADRQGLVTYKPYQYPSPIGESTWKLRLRPRLGALIKLIVKGPSFLRQPLPRRSPATTTTAAAALYANPVPCSASFTSPQRLDC